MKTAIVHYWLLGMRGGEKVVEALCKLLPNADIYTLFYDPQRVSPLIRAHNVSASFLNPYRRCYRSLLPLMPFALEAFDLRAYDLIISSESGPAKGVLTTSASRHVCYCHSPMRYLWDLYPAYLHDWTRSSLRRALIHPLASLVRMWDFSTAARVDHFIANSQNVRQRIRKTYRRDSQVIYPPVDVKNFYHAEPDNYYLIVSELVAYKRIEDAVRCFTRTGRDLAIVGNGPEYKRLKALAGPTVKFLGRVPDSELRELYARSRAVIVPGEEDFGIVAVEAMASGKAVIALGRGGVLECVPQSYLRSGLLYREPGEYPLERAVNAFELQESLISPAVFRSHAMPFSEDRFCAEMRQILLGNAPEMSRDVAAVSAGNPDPFYKEFTTE